MLAGSVADGARRRASWARAPTEEDYDDIDADRSRSCLPPCSSRPAAAAATALDARLRVPARSRRDRAGRRRRATDRLRHRSRLGPVAAAPGAARQLPGRATGCSTRSRRSSRPRASSWERTSSRRSGRDRSRSSTRRGRENVVVLTQPSDEAKLDALLAKADEPLVTARRRGRLDGDRRRARRELDASRGGRERLADAESVPRGA